MSGEHAAVVTILADSFLEDLGSTNGTLVNGKPIAKHFLRDRDQIDIGRQKLVYLADESAQLDLTERSLGRLDNQLFGERVAPAKSVADFDVPSSRSSAAEPIARGRTAQSPPAEEKRQSPNPDERVGQGAAPRMDSGGSMSDIDRFVAAEVGNGTDAERAASSRFAEPAPAPEIVSSPPAKVPVIRVLTGPSAGREVALDKAETSVGRVGVQVAAVRRTDDGLRLVPVEGAEPPSVNGEAVGAEGQTLRTGDTLEIAGVQLEIAEAPIIGAR